MLYNNEEFVKMNYDAKIEFFKKCEKDAIEYQTKTKSEMILIIALYLKESKYVLKDIKHKILEDLGDLVTGRYIDMCLTEEFKPRQIKRKEKIDQKVPLIGADGSTILDESTPNKKSEREDLANLKTPSIAMVPVGQNAEDLVAAPKIDINYVESLERQILAFKGEIGYTDMLAQHRIAKLSRQSIQTLLNASKKCAKFVYITIDIRTNEASKIIADKDWKKVIPKEEKLTPKQKTKVLKKKNK